MTTSQQRLIDSAWEYGVDNVIAASPASLSEEFKEFNKEVLSAERGAGYWVWKAYIIYKTMLCDFVNDGDIIFYSDAGIEIVGDLHSITDNMQEDIFLFSGRFPHHEWCKMDVINSINYFTETTYGELRSEYFDKLQIQASNMFIRVNNKSRAFIKEWLLYCQMPGFIDDSPSGEYNSDTFQEHRHDQAILMCLAIKYGIKSHWYPSTTNLDKRTDFLNDSYPPIFDHHRKRNNEY